MVKAVVLATSGNEDIELVTCVDVLRRAKIDTSIASVDTDMLIKCANGTVITADTTLSQIQDYDCLVLPGGGKAAQRFTTDPAVQSLIKKAHASGKWIGAICAAPMALAAAGILATATIYPGMEQELSSRGVQCVVDGSDDVVVVDGKVVTSRGPATAMRFALSLVECLVGSDERDSVAKGLLYKC